MTLPVGRDMIQLEDYQLNDGRLRPSPWRTREPSEPTKRFRFLVHRKNVGWMTLYARSYKPDWHIRRGTSSSMHFPLHDRSCVFRSCSTEDTRSVSFFCSAVTAFEYSWVSSKVVIFVVHSCCNWLSFHLHPWHWIKLIFQRLKCTAIQFKQFFSCVRERRRIAELGGVKHRKKINSIYIAPTSDFSYFDDKWLMSEWKIPSDKTVIRTDRRLADWSNFVMTRSNVPPSRCVGAWGTCWTRPTPLIISLSQTERAPLSISTWMVRSPSAIVWHL